MKTVEITTSASKARDARSVTLTVNWPETTKEKVEHWGEDVTNSLADSNAFIQFQSVVRRCLQAMGDKSMTNDQIRRAFPATWVPKIGRDRMSPTDRAIRSVHKELAAGADINAVKRKLSEWEKAEKAKAA